ncbi:nuclear transport factor 2 family protein [Sphingomonas sp. SRS2]|uniref:nuclear transport factor 2 family protein n=1 Tax=Sphingomonas sp. SRS2 TaxID=133190 RepID=UPI00061846F2|nr:nuclear transport factor 2 family protein [Sphingomonas sp. SRS2]KKC25222.1 hypothetical protein WP12_15240 [Sphingomonas sp. SRS2]
MANSHHETLRGRTGAEARIKRLIAAYNIAGDRGRLDEIAACFAADGVLQTPLWQAAGRSEIAAGLRNSNSRGDSVVQFVRHHVTTSLISFDGDVVTGRSYFLVFTQIGPDHAGVYVDRYRQEDGEWRIAHRQVRIDWKAPESLFVNQPVSRVNSSGGPR